ncbi:MAG TPA: aldo/keto reductase, partial [Thiohalobacter sp.]|nr:aldo/keto reductase [Thiohalobacter sp.]
MQYRKLGRTDLDVSLICLGTMTFGEQNTERDAHEQLDRAVAAGVNFIDTAELYPVPPRGETQGRTEQYIGSWLSRRGRRDDLVIATKVAGPTDWCPHIRGGTSHPDANNIEIALNDSLQRLNTDYIDLYQVHWPDRSANFFGKLGYEYDDSSSLPIEDTLEALARQVEAALGGVLLHQLGALELTLYHAFLCHDPTPYFLNGKFSALSSARPSSSV